MPKASAILYVKSHTRILRNCVDQNIIGHTTDGEIDFIHGHSGLVFVKRCQS